MIDYMVWGVAVGALLYGFFRYSQQRKKVKESCWNTDLLQAISSSQARFILNQESEELFEEFLGHFLRLSESKLGFIGEVVFHQGQPQLLIHGFGNTSSGENGEPFFEKYAGGSQGNKSDTVISRMLSDEKPLVINDMSNADLKMPLPPGHPALHRFLGLPILSSRRLVGLVGLANRSQAYPLSLVNGLDPLLNTCGQMLEVFRIQRFRRMAEAAFESLSKRNDLILNAAGEGIFGTDAQGRITFANPAASKLLGCSVMELIGRDLHPLAHRRHPDGSELLVEHCSACATLRDRQTHHGRDETFWNLRGDSFPVDYVTTPVLEEEVLVGMVAVFRDTAERKMIEEALRQANLELETRVEERTSELSQANQMLRKEITGRIHVEEELALRVRILDKMIDAIFVHDHDGRLLYVNESAFRVRGFSREKLLEKQFSELEHQEGGAAFGERQLELCQRGEIIYETSHVTASGSFFPVEVHASLVPTRGKSLVISVVRDITERRKAGQVLREFESFNQEVISNAGEGIMVLGDEEKIVLWNQMMTRFFGFQAREAKGKWVGDLWPRWRECGLETLSRKAREGEKVVSPDLPWHDAASQTGRWLEVSFAPNCGEFGRVVGVIGIVRDVSERRHYEMELERFTQKLEESNEELRTFAYAASHDLQEPLRKISTFSDRLRQKAWERMEDGERDYLDRIQGASFRLQKLIQGLLEYSRITTKTEPFQTVDLMTVFQEVLQDLEVVVEESKATIQCDSLPTIEASPVLMRQLFQNLLSNSLKFRALDRPTIVKVQALDVPDQTPMLTGIGPLRAGAIQPGAVQPGAVRLTFSDNGIGFESKFHRRIFGVFQRLHGRSEYEGTGVGLAICRKIVERHSGQMWAEGHPGEGSTFTVILPKGAHKESKVEGGGHERVFSAHH